MNFQIFTNIGNNRKNNEDNYLILKPIEETAIIAVADGMGGHNAGEVASKIAIESIKEYDFDFKNDNLIIQIKEAIKTANLNIIKYSTKDKDKYKEMGTTLTMGIIYNQNLYFGHVGDSRIYLYDNKLEQITTDHSLVNNLIENNSIKPEEAFDHPQKNIITQAVGIDKDLKIQTDIVKLNKEDKLMYCTDGLTDMIRFEKLKEMFEQTKKIEELINRLGEKALENGGNDNITIILGKI